MANSAFFLRLANRSSAYGQILNLGNQSILLIVCAKGKPFVWPPNLPCDRTRAYARPIVGDILQPSSPRFTKISIHCGIDRTSPLQTIRNHTITMRWHLCRNKNRLFWTFSPGISSTNTTQFNWYHFDGSKIQGYSGVYPRTISRAISTNFRWNCRRATRKVWL